MLYLAPATPPETTVLCQQLERRFGQRPGVTGFATHQQSNGEWIIYCQIGDRKQRPTALSEIISFARPVCIEVLAPASTPPSPPVGVAG